LNEQAGGIREVRIGTGAGEAPSLVEALALPGVDRVVVPAGVFPADLLIAGRVEIRGERGTVLQGRILLRDAARLKLQGLSLRGSIILDQDATLDIEDCVIDALEGPALLMSGAARATARATRLFATGSVVLAADNARLSTEDCAIRGDGPGPCAVGLSGQARMTMLRGETFHSGANGVQVVDQARLDAQQALFLSDGSTALMFDDDAQGSLNQLEASSGSTATVKIGGRASPSFQGGDISAVGGCAVWAVDQAAPSFNGTVIRGCPRGEEPAVVLAGFSAATLIQTTIKGGASVGLGIQHDAGGKIVDSSIEGAGLAGVLLSDRASTRFEACRLIANSAGNLFATGGSSVFEDCGFAQTEAPHAGIVLGGETSVRLERCVIIDSGGAGIELLDEPPVRIANCIIRNNRAGIVGLTRRAYIDGCVLEGNGDDVEAAAAPSESPPFVAIEAEPADRRPPELIAAMIEIDRMIGLASVKSAIRDFVDLNEIAADRLASGMPGIKGVTLHSAFLGAPGTGKTTVARQMGAIFRALGLLTSGHVVEVDRGALVGQVVGETAQKTAAKIREAQGGILFIDEAYDLFRSDGLADFGGEAVSALVKGMEDSRDNLAVILAGYPDRMTPLLQSNPGLSGRIGFTFNFQDYAPAELLEIFRVQLSDSGYIPSPAALDLTLEELKLRYARRDARFANARMVRGWAEKAGLAQARRLAKEPRQQRTLDALRRIERLDVEPLATLVTGLSPAEPLAVVMAELDGLVGLDSVKNQVRALAATIRLAADRRLRNLPASPHPRLHSLYVGNPGTGKTTVARLMGRILKALGVLPSGHVVEAQRGALVGAYIGETAGKTQALIETAMGGVLFVDEAYALTSGTPGDFGAEAIQTLLTAMENRGDAFVVIAAGYSREMDGLLASNSGLASRFPHRFDFADYNGDELIRILEDRAASEGFVLGAGVQEALAERLAVTARTGNARMIRNAFEHARQALALRTEAVPDEAKTVELLSTLLLEDWTNAPI
jgi:SpoVK/Ycf46/Vps4 family AAA+-type ATPase